MVSNITEARGKSKAAKHNREPQYELIFGKTFRKQYKMMSNLYKTRIDQLINHHTYGDVLRGVDKMGSGILQEYDVRHFHIELQKADPLLAYQLKDGILNMIMITTHKDNFESNELNFIEAIKDDLI